MEQPFCLEDVTMSTCHQYPFEEEKGFESKAIGTVIAKAKKKNHKKRGGSFFLLA
jgi:hypothetical protein